MHDIPPASDASVSAQFANTVFDFLRQMHDEADTIVGNDVRAGLVHYAMHCGKKQHERSLCRRLAELMTQAGHAARTKVRYPGQSRQKCDVVVGFEGAEPVWLEVKTAWKTWMESSGEIKNNSPSIYRSYLLGSAGGLEKSHSTAQDFEKLSQLSATDASHMACLLFGFDAVDSPMDPDIEELARREQLTSRGWEAYGPETWPDYNGSRCRVLCWLWCRQAGSHRGAPEQ